MREPTNDDIRDAEQALYRVMRLVRLALHAMDDAGVFDLADDDKRGRIVQGVGEVLETVMRDAESAGDKLAELKIGDNYA